MKARIIKTGRVCELVNYDNGVYPYMDPETGDLFNSSEFIVCSGRK